ncbi:OLC1v1003648C1 [Oldenlandia corymbosa var. corymbosa]|uniref:OLC1v1003648C1 n=1 Tax=Oldenlandia corymbosa var. corymbosa TaxID=529605 RepID=A0AAV1DCV7_OLDCO|nr:OLC1v1003648C1 [Oldenlandia corymbosa var. corymbosa]
MGGKVVISIVSLILVVGVVIGAVVVVRHGNSEVSGASRGSMKSVDKFCEPAPFKDACARSLESVANNASATPKDYLIAALQATVEEVNKGLDVVGNTKIDEKNDSFHHMAVEDCKELLGYAVDELQAAITSVGNSQLHTLSDRVHDLLNWLGAVYSYQTYCIDEFEKPVYKSSIQNGLLNATRLTNNAMDIVASLSDILKSFNIPIPSTNRKLLGAMGHDGFPTWFQAGDRKLLAQQESGQLVPNAVVAKDGSGQFKTISDALRAYPPKGFTGRYIIYVKAGVYEENVIVDKKQTNVFIYGDGAGKTIVTGDKNYGIMHIQTSNTATFYEMIHH